MSKAVYHPSDLVIQTGTGSVARVLKRDADKYGKTFYNLIALQGGGRYIQRVVYPDQLLPLTDNNVVALLGGPSGVTVRDEDGAAGDFAVTVYCDAEPVNA